MRTTPRLIGVIHLGPLPGAPGVKNRDPAIQLDQVGTLAVREAQVLVRAGFEGLIIENFGDEPFYASRVPPETVAAMSIIAATVRETARGIPVGVNILRNDAASALAVAAVAGCDFIRVNILSGVAATDQGIIEGTAATLIRERSRLNANRIGIFADVLVKHARPLSGESIELAIEEAALRAGADAVIVTGATTGRPVDLAKLKRARQASRHCAVPLYIGSGATPETLFDLFQLADGVIVGSALRSRGKAGAPLDSKRVASMVKAFRKAVATRGKWTRN
ncbi:MAG: BtpA/SgcQ family protein [Bdellovibrionota bacterium]